MQTKTYKKFQPYGRLTILKSGKRYHLLAPTPFEGDAWAEYSNMQTWSVASVFDGFDGEIKGTYSENLGVWMHDPITLVVHPMNIAIELHSNAKEIYLWDGEYQEEQAEETEVDLSEDESYLMPDYLLDVALPVMEDYPINSAPYLDDGFPV